jgi:predicted AAA+ superfamily ATPase
MYRRYLQLDLPPKQSAFLWGARKTGKSTYLKDHFPHSVYYDFLHSDAYLEFIKAPYLFRQEILRLTAEQLAYPIIVDEVQKIPMVLNEIHWLIENTPAYFILCGSSARSLRRHGVNLLGGRAWSFHFYPLIYPEFPHFDLLKIMKTGSIPSHFDSSNPKKSLKAYVNDYLTQEVQAEGLARSLPAFARFLDCLGFSNGQQVNYTNIARDVGVDAKTIKEYFQILIDTLLGYYILPFHKKIKRDIQTHTPKFYLFDAGVANFLGKNTIESLGGFAAGQSFEHIIFLELIAYREFSEKDFPITYWRTKTGLEVDFVLGDAEVAIEVKLSDHRRPSDFAGLTAFHADYLPKKSIIVSTASRARQSNNFITELPYEVFLQDLWNGKLI